jgi:hypothetical protein
MRRLMAAVVAITLATSMPSAVVAWTVNACAPRPGAVGLAPTWHTWRNVSGRHYYRVSATFIIRDLRGCWFPNFPDDSHAAVYINLFDTRSGDAVRWPAIQLGYHSADSGAAIWYYTPSEHGNGVVTAMPNMAFQPYEVIGKTVKLEIYPHPANPTWRLRVTVTSTGQTDFVDIPRDLSQGWVNKIWYGIETHNEYDRFGGSTSSNQVNLKWMGYRYTGDGVGSDIYLQGTTSAWANANVPSLPNCWRESATTYSADGTTYSQLNGYTSDDC